MLQGYFFDRIRNQEFIGSEHFACGWRRRVLKYMHRLLQVVAKAKTAVRTKTRSTVSDHILVTLITCPRKNAKLRNMLENVCWLNWKIWESGLLFVYILHRKALTIWKEKVKSYDLFVFFLKFELMNWWKIWEKM